jgi:hypothetical protein
VSLFSILPLGHVTFRINKIFVSTWDGVAEVEEGEELEEVGDSVLVHLLVEPQAAQQGAGNLPVVQEQVPRGFKAFLG